MPSHKLKSSKKERKKVMRTLGHQKETSSLTWVLVLFLLLYEANNVAAKRKKARHTQGEGERQESEGLKAGRQRRREGRRGAQLAAATKRESENRAMVSGLLRRR